MVLSWQEIRSRAYSFAREWADTEREEADAKPFLDAFFAVLGIPRRKVATFEYKVRKLGGSKGYIDLLWKGVFLVEMKSRGKDLGEAYQQALDYCQTLPEYELPRLLLVSDFEHWHLYDMEEANQHPTVFTLAELPQYIRLFGRLIGYQSKQYTEQDPANIQAAEQMGHLHDRLWEIGYRGHQLELYLVRLLFLLFAEDTGILERQFVQDFIRLRTAEDGSDLGAKLGELFQILDTPPEARYTNLEEELQALPYVNGGLFADPLPIAHFDRSMRESLLGATRLDWAKISPAIFGSMFQSVMDADSRHALGAHYTSEANILKVLKGLYLDELWSEFERCKHQPKALDAFHKRLGELRFLDPACGCGNFLIVAYRELRLLELEVLRIRFADLLERASVIDQAVEVDNLLKVQVDQFYGIEYEDFPAQIALVAMWLIDHQMNTRVSEVFGTYYARLPLRRSAHIVQGDALELDWLELLGGKRLDYIIGNPPFIGSKVMSDKQRRQVKRLFPQSGGGTLDYVAAWYMQAAQLMQAEPHIRTAFVSTNSITQGEQVACLWAKLLPMGMYINFAHRTFKWSNEARGVAAVYCVIIGFSARASAQPRLYSYDDVRGTAEELIVRNINPYLIEGDNLLIPNRTKPICDVPEISKGNQPTDGGNLILSREEREELIDRYPELRPYIKSLIGAEEYLHRKARYCLWFPETVPALLRDIPELKERFRRVVAMRELSSDPRTRELAYSPFRFRETRNYSSFIIIPSTSSEHRHYIPMGFGNAELIPTNAMLIIPEGDLFLFGILMSHMHMVWVSAVCGRLESRYRYSKKGVYNNFPFPQGVASKLRANIEAAAEAVLTVREQYPDASLADLYDPLAMPVELRRAHTALDRAVERAYRYRAFENDVERLHHLFERYQALTATLLEPKPRKRSTRTKA